MNGTDGMYLENVVVLDALDLADEEDEEDEEDVADVPIVLEEADTVDGLIRGDGVVGMDGEDGADKLYCM